jgi:hypothetical protein
MKQKCTHEYNAMFLLTISIIVLIIVKKHLLSRSLNFNCNVILKLNVMKDSLWYATLNAFHCVSNVNELVTEPCIEQKTRCNALNGSNFKPIKPLDIYFFQSR